MKALGLDCGEKWIGISISDSEKLFAKPLLTTEIKKAFETIASLINEEKIDELVYGKPITLSGKISHQTTATELFISKLSSYLKKQIGNKDQLPKFIAVDERLSTKFATKIMAKKSSGKEKRKWHKRNKGVEHRIAAAIILQNYLDFRKNTNQSPH